MDENLRIYIPALMLVAMLILLFWKYVRQAIPIRVPNPNIEKLTNYNRLRRLGGYYWILFCAFLFITLIYTLTPELYSYLLPIERLDHPLINEVGLIVMKLSLVWILIAQIQLDRELYKYSRKIDNLEAMELVHFSEKTLLSGILLLFLGFLITITSITGIFLVISGFILYFKNFRFGYMS